MGASRALALQGFCFLSTSRPYDRVPVIVRFACVFGPPAQWRSRSHRHRSGSLILACHELDAQHRERSAEGHEQAPAVSEPGIVARRLPGQLGVVVALDPASRLVHEGRRQG